MQANYNTANTRIFYATGNLYCSIINVTGKLTLLSFVLQAN